MPTLNEASPAGPPLTRHEDGGWTWLERKAEGEARRVLVMLHGWTGDETSMSLFTRTVPRQYAILLPRAPLRAPEGGYTWREITPGNWGLPTLAEMQEATENLLGFIDRWMGIHMVGGLEIDVAGFSQGAAMAFSLALLHPERISRVAALSGFLPEGSEERLAALQGKKIFIAHGREDEVIPVEFARQAKAMLEAHGTEVTYCESEGGHKVGKQCLKGMETFLIIG